MKRVLTLQDFSCFGKCSLTVAMPVISAMGVECVAVPSAILSTHTGQLGDVTVVEIESRIDAILSHIKRLGVSFDVIYIGYLGTPGLVDIASRLISSFKTENTIVLLDPVMGDNGRLYSRFTGEYVEEIASLASLSDYVLPNLTEAALLADIEYAGEEVSGEYLERVFERLHDSYSTRFIVTGVCTGTGEIGAVFSASSNNISRIYTTKRNPSGFHGAGDLFASVLAAGLAKGLSLSDTLAKSVDFVREAIDATVAAGTDERYGLHFESCLGSLTV